MEIPTADILLWGIPAGSEDVDLSTPAVATLVTELEAHVISDQGNAITVQRGMKVGRNL
jgi:hypothetical protein